MKNELRAAILMTCWAGLAHAQQTDPAAGPIDAAVPTTSPPPSAEPAPPPVASPTPSPELTAPPVTSPTSSAEPAPPPVTTPTPSPAAKEAPEPTRSRADGYSNTGDDGWPRTSTGMELGGYGSYTATSSFGVRPGTKSWGGGGYLDVCLFCVWTNEHRFAIGDSQALHVGSSGVILREGIVAAFGITPDVDVGARLLYQYGGFGGISRHVGLVVVEGRWQRFAGSAAFASGYFGATGRVMIDRIWGAHLFFDQMSPERASGGPSTSSFRVALALSL